MLRLILSLLLGFGAGFIQAARTKTSIYLYHAVLHNEYDEAIKAAELGGNGDYIPKAHGKSALMIAVEKDHAPMVQMLLDRARASPNRINSRRDSAMSLALDKASDEIIRMLVTHGGDVNVPDRRTGSTALIAAVQGGAGSRVKMLLELGANADVVDSTGSAPLILAARMNALFIIGLLLEYGASTNAQDNEGVSALMEAVQSFDSPQRRAAMVSALLSKPINLNLQDHEGNTALMYLISEHGDDSLELMQRLIDAGSNIHLTDTDGNTALMMAAYNGYTGCVQVLLRNNGAVDITVRSREGQTALSLARNEEIREILRKAMMGQILERNRLSPPHAAAARRLR